MTTQKAKILQLLRRGPCTTVDFLYTRFEDGKMVTNEWRARLSEMRGSGYQIEYDRKDKMYRLLSEPPKAGPNGQFELGLNDQKYFLDKKGDVW